MKKLLSVFLTIVMLALPMAEMTAFAAPGAIAVSDSAAEIVEMPAGETASLSEESGWCGDTADNLTWILDDEGTLTISGTGGMAKWWNEYDIPWYSHRLSVKKLVIEDGVENMSYMAFRDLTNLETVTIGSDFAEYGYYCFYNCTSLKSITVDEDNETYCSDEYGVLYEKLDEETCMLVQYPAGSERTSFTITGDVQNVLAESFRDSKNLKNITISDGVRFIEAGAFWGCTGLESVVIPDSVEVLCGDAFNQCSSLKTITLGSGLYRINNEYFEMCEALERIIVDEDNEYFLSDEDGVLYNKDKTELLKYPVARKSNSFVIPDTVEVIYEEAFANAVNLESVVIPDSVTTIGVRAFYWCENLASITMGENVADIGEYAFYNTEYYNDRDNWENNVLYLVNCLIFSELSGYELEYTVKDGTKTIADNAFEYSNGIESIIVPESVTHIGDYAFYQGYDLVNVTLGDSVERIGKNAFNGILYYTDEDNWDGDLLYIGDYLVASDYNVSGSCTVKDGTLIIADGVFESREGLTGVKIPDSVEVVGSEAFFNCHHLESVTMGKNVTYMGDMAFYNCFNLESIVIPDKVKTIGKNTFEYCENLSEVTIGTGVTSIDDMAFYCCFNLKSIVIPDNVKSIGVDAFHNSGLETAYIGLGVTSIGDGAFDYCNNLVIHGYANSAAQKYANQNWIDFVVRTSNGLMVSYDANGGKDAPAAQIKEKNKSLTLSSDIPTRSGYTFKGWAVTPGGSVKYAPGAKYTDNKSITLYAVWEGGLNLPDDYEKKVEIKNGVMEAPGLYVEAIGDRELKVTLGGITIRDSYNTNLSSSNINDCEYEWSVRIKSPSEISYVVSTASWAFDPGRNEIKTFEEMQHSLWLETNRSGNLLDNAEMSHTSDTVTWTFTIPEDLPFDFSETTQFVVVVYDPYDTYIERTYTVAEGILLADKVEFAPLSTTSLAVGKTLSLNATASCKNGRKPESTKVIYEIVSGKEFATIDAYGKLKGISSGGEVVVRATAEMGTETAFAEVTIKVCIPATKVSLSTTKASMVVGGKALCLEATVAPENHTDTLIWESDDEEIATVDENGVVTAHKAGKVKITALAGSGKKATCTVTIGAPADTVEFTSLKSTSLAVGKTLSLKGKAYCEDGTKPVSSNVVFEIVDGHDFATIDAKGKLKGLATGEVIVRATAESGTETAFADVVINVCIPATKVTLDKTKAAMIVGGEGLELVAEMLPLENSDTLTWESSDEEVATVEEVEKGVAVVTAHKAGKVKITALAGSGKKATCSITIGIPADTVEFTTDDYTALAVGKTLTLKAKAYREDGEKPVSTNVVYEIVEGSEYAEIDAKGKLKGLGIGEVVVRATAEAGTEEAFAEITINVCIPATKVTLDKTKAAMIVGGEGLELVAEMLPLENSDILTWESSDEEVATVEEVEKGVAVVTAHKAGKVKITALAGSGKKATCSVTIGAPADTVEFTSLKSTSLAVGKTLSLKGKAYCEDGTKPVSSNVVFEIVDGHDFATIDAKGKLKGIATGEVIVRATAEAGTETAFAEIVINVCIPATKVTLNKTKATVTAGEKVYLVATLSPENHTDTLTWSSSNESIATVDKEGVVTTLKEGSVKITATSGSGKKATCTIKVEKKDLTATLPELVLENIVYEYFEEDFIIESNPGAVGGMHISATVVGPDEVRAVLIAEWGTDIREMSLKQIKERAIWYSDLWKKSGLSFNEDRKLPFQFGNSHPVDADELGRNHQVLLVGLDAQCNAVGYYILDGYVPAQ